MKKIKHEEIDGSKYSRSGKILKKKQTKPYHLLVFSKNCCIKLKKFSSMASLNEFVTNFLTDNAHNKDDNWIEFIVEGITGEVKIVEDTVNYYES